MPDGSSLSEAKAGVLLVLVICIYVAIFFGIMALATSKADSDDYSHSSATVQDSNVSNNNGIAAKTESDNFAAIVKLKYNTESALANADVIMFSERID